MIPAELRWLCQLKEMLYDCEIGYRIHEDEMAWSVLRDVRRMYDAEMARVMESCARVIPMRTVLN